jgi:hypothetical protein
MKNIFLFWGIAFFLFSCNGSKETKELKAAKSNLTMYKLKGRIKYLTEASYHAIDSSGHAVKTDLRRLQNWIFDEKGNFTERKSKRVGDSVAQFYICKYDTGEHLLKDSNNEFMGNSWTVYLYDAKGNRIERDQYYSDSGKSKRGVTELYKVDERGYKIEEDCYWGNKDSLNYKAYIKNNEQGQEIEKATFDDKGKPFIKVVRVYDAKGNQVEYQMYNKHDSLERRETFKYDDKDNEIEWCTYNSTGKLESKTTVKYGDKGNISESEMVTERGSSSDHYANHYDNFDKEGNWLKKVSMANGKPEIIEERVIEYYQ